MKKTMEKDRLIHYYCSEDFLELYLGTFRICDRPKRMIFRFLSEENLLEECETSSPVRPGRPNELFLFPVQQQMMTTTKTNSTTTNNMLYKDQSTSFVEKSIKQRFRILIVKSTIVLKSSGKFEGDFMWCTLFL